MTVLGIGIDLFHIPRLASLVARRGLNRFARRVLSDVELEKWDPRGDDSLRYLAVRYALRFFA